MHGLLYRLRSVQSWPETQALVTQVEELTRDERGGDWNRVFFTYKPKDGYEQSGVLKVESFSSLFNVRVGDTFPLQYDPQRPRRFYSEESQSIFKTMRYVMLTAVVLFALFALLGGFLGH